MVDYYKEGMIQLGFVLLFAPSFPLAAIFCVLTNLLEIKIKINLMAHQARRIESEAAQGVGAWMGIMEFISLICIPANVALMYFTGTRDS